MIDLSDFPITRKWPAKFPDRIQLYSLNTPNGVKVSIMLEETGLAYEPHRVRFKTNDQKSPEFASLNPNMKIPAIIDPNGPGNRAAAPVRIRRNPALSRGKKRPVHSCRTKSGHIEVLQWLMFQMSFIGPMFGQVGFFHKFEGRHL